MKPIKIVAVLCAIVLCIVLNGCQIIGIDVKNQMRPPKNNGDQEALQNALESYIQSTIEKGEPSEYALKYPVSGEYRSSFILFNQIKAPNVMRPMGTGRAAVSNETQLKDYGVVFYRMDTDNANTHINLLKRTDNGWVSVADVGGYGEEIAQVDFGDVNGDGFPELMVGWNLYNSNNKRLTIYDVKNGLTLLSSDKMYTSFLVNDFTADGSADLLLLSAWTADHSVSARLFSFSEGELVLRDLVELDGGIQRFEQLLLVEQEPGVTGVYVDCYKDPHTVITELIYWKDRQLYAPFHDLSTGLTSDTAREMFTYCNDMDLDGIVEIPRCNRLPGYEEADVADAFWKTSWYSYSISDGKFTHEFDSVVNSHDSYVMKLSPNWPKNFTVYYDEQTRVMSFCETEDAKTVFLEIQTNLTGKTADLLEGFSYFDSTGSLHYALRLYQSTNGFALSATEVQYLFSVM